MVELIRPKVLVTRQLPESVLARLRSVADVDVFEEAATPIPRGELLRRVQATDGLLCLLTDAIDEAVIAAAGPSLKVIANMAVGYDNIDVRAAARQGIWVTHTPGVLTETTADLTFALLLATARRVVEAERYLREGRWSTWAPMLLAGVDVYGSSLGVIGMGRIGEAVVRRARGFGMSVVYHNRSRRPDVEATLGCQYTSLPELLQTSDFVVVLTPLTEATRGLIGREELGLMKPTAVLVNTARGPVVDEAALVEALRSRQIWAAGLDVYAEEPLPMDHPLRELDNVVLLPHIGSASIQTRTKMAMMAAENALAGLSGTRPPNVVPTWDQQQ